MTQTSAFNYKAKKTAPQLLSCGADFIPTLSLYINYHVRKRKKHANWWLVKQA